MDASPNAGPPRLLESVRDARAVRHYSRRTEEAYVAWVRRFVVFAGRRHPRDLGPGDVRRFLSALATRGNVGTSTHIQALAALLFLYRDVLRAPLEGRLEGVAPARRPARLPAVLTRDEVRAALSKPICVWVQPRPASTALRLLYALPTGARWPAGRWPRSRAAGERHPAPPHPGLAPPAWGVDGGGLRLGASAGRARPPTSAGRQPRHDAALGRNISEGGACSC